MILRRLTMTNFRQFKGQQVLKFAVPDDGHNANVTVVFGENGRGKTGIFRAVMFCLFGERRLTQDGNIPDSDIQLVNATALDQAEGRPVEASVELEFYHGGCEYTLSRTLKCIRIDGIPVEQLDRYQLTQQTPDGNTRFVDTDRISDVVNSILDPGVKDYFLFDGEKIERLTRASADQRREISAGIRNLLQIDSLQSAAGALASLTRRLEAGYREQASPELARLLGQLGEVETKLEKDKERLRQLDEEVSCAEAERSDLDRKLEEFSEIREAVVARNEAEKQLQLLEQQKANQLTSFRQLPLRTGYLLARKPVRCVYDHIEQQKQRGDIPSEIRKDLIEKIIKEEMCICGRPIPPGSPEFALICEWRSKTPDIPTQDAALDLWRHLSELLVRLPEDAQFVENELIKYANLCSDIDKVRHRIETLGAEIGGAERKDAAKLDQLRSSLEQKIGKLFAQRNATQSAIDEGIEAQAKLVNKIRQQHQLQGRLNELGRRAELARKVWNALTQVISSFTQDIEKELGDLATELFQALLEPEARRILKKIIVNSDHSLEVIDQWGRPFLANISAGQRQIMSIAFITALASKASRNGLLEMPLFMDTPFGRLSAAHRDNLIQQVPDLASQWILLATDTEFRSQEASLLSQGQRWGAFYTLRPTEDGSTLLVEQRITDAPGLLLGQELAR